MKKIDFPIMSIVFLWFYCVMPLLGGCSRDQQPIPIQIPIISPARYAHTATKLQDGRILIVGGLVGTADHAYVTNSALIINPNTGDVQTTGSLSCKRFRHTATLLRDGRVLIAGGQSEDPFVVALNHAEIFNPAKNKFEPAANPMTFARHTHTATFLANDLVLLAGGDGPYPDSVWNQCELFDPTTARFISIQPMMHCRTGHNATLLDSGQVLIAGGVSWMAGYHETAELFDPITSTFRSVEDIYPIPYSYCDSAQKLLSGRVFMLNMSLNLAALYDPNTEKFEKTGALIHRRKGATCTLIEDTGIIVVIGGYIPNSGFTPILQMEKYDPDTGLFVKFGSIVQPRFSHTATYLSNCQLLLVGGFGSDKNTIEKCELIQVGKCFIINMKAERRDARAFSILRQYGQIEFTVKTSDIQVAQYRIMRRQDSGDFVLIKTIDPSELQNNQFQMQDKYLEKDIAYTYRVEAYDAAEQLIVKSLEKTI